MSDGAREIENLVYTYAERLDAGDLDGVATGMIINEATMTLAGANGCPQYASANRIHS